MYALQRNVMNKKNVLYSIGLFGSLAVGGLGGYLGHRYHADSALSGRHAEVVRQASDELYERTFPSLLSARRERNAKGRYLIEELNGLYSTEARRLYDGTENIVEDKKFEVMLDNLEGILRRCRTPNLSQRIANEFHQLTTHVRWLEGRTGKFTAFILGANGVYEPSNIPAGYEYERWRNSLPEMERRE